MEILKKRDGPNDYMLCCLSLCVRFYVKVDVREWSLLHINEFLFPLCYTDIYWQAHFPQKVCILLLLWFLRPCCMNLKPSVTGLSWGEGNVVKWHQVSKRTFSVMSDIFLLQHCKTLDYKKFLHKEWPLRLLNATGHFYHPRGCVYEYVWVNMHTLSSPSPPNPQ